MKAGTAPAKGAADTTSTKGQTGTAPAKGATSASKQTNNRPVNINSVSNAAAGAALHWYDKGLMKAGLRPTDLESFKKPG